MQLIPYTRDNARHMIFVDGENLAIRYGALLGKNVLPGPNIEFIPNILVWPKQINYAEGRAIYIIRKYYYTAAGGADDGRREIEDKLKSLDFVPRVFKKDKKKGSKRVDITLATEMLMHAARGHYEAAILVAGDEDYVPLVEAVQREGARVFVWFVSSGISRALRMASDYFVDLDETFIGPAGSAKDSDTGQGGVIPSRALPWRQRFPEPDVEPD